MVDELDLEQEEDGTRSGFDWQGWVEEHRWYLLVGLVGLFLLGLGVRVYKSSGQVGWFKNVENRVEILSTNDTAVDGKRIVVDVGGAVNKPGVYEFDYNARVDDAIVTAGGLTEMADGEWMEKVLNRAERLRDGQKVYIFSTEELKNIETEKPGGQSGLYQGIVSGSSVAGSVSVNTASQSELEALWGIGPVTAEAIISGRPYGEVKELLDRGILKRNVWDRNRDKLGL
jgi:competence protein ComEA